MALIKGGGNGNRVSGQCVLYKMICRHPVGQEMYHRIWEEIAGEMRKTVL